MTRTTGAAVSICGRAVHRSASTVSGPAWRLGNDHAEPRRARAATVPVGTPARACTRTDEVPAARGCLARGVLRTRSAGGAPAGGSLLRTKGGEAGDLRTRVSSRAWPRSPQD